MCSLFIAQWSRWFDMDISVHTLRARSREFTARVQPVCIISSLSTFSDDVMCQQLIVSTRKLLICWIICAQLPRCNAAISIIDAIFNVIAAVTTISSSHKAPRVSNGVKLSNNQLTRGWHRTWQTICLIEQQNTSAFITMKKCQLTHDNF